MKSTMACPDQEPAFDADPRRIAATQLQGGNINLRELWTYYYGIGGNADEVALDAYLNEMAELPPLQADLLHTALKEITAEGN